jgi:hypothetical protein
MASEQDLQRHLAMLRLTLASITEKRGQLDGLIEHKDALLREMFFGLGLMIPEIAELTGLPASTVRHACKADPERYRAHMKQIGHLVHRRRAPRSPA